MHQKKIDRTAPPISGIRPEVEFPTFEKTTLSNGIKVYLYRDAAQPLVSIKAIIKNGAAAEPVAGLANLTARLLIKGTENRSASEIARESDLIGAALSASSTWDYTTLGIISLNDYMKRAFDLFEDCMLNPEFSEDETARLRARQISNIRQKNVDPRYLSRVAFNSVHFHNHPYGHLRNGTIDTVESIKGEDCRNFYEKLLTGSDITFIVSGNMVPDDVVQRLERRFGDLVFEESIKPTHAEPVIDKGVVAIEKKNAEQAGIFVGRSTIDRNDADFSALRLLNTIYGGYFMSRLNHRLREERGFTYGAMSSIDSRLLSTALIAGTSVNKKNTAAAIEEIIDLLDEINRNMIDEDELSRARQFMLGSFVRGLETPQQISTQLQALDVYNLQEDYFEKFITELNSFTPDDLMPVQKRLFKKEPVVISAAGDIEYMRNQLAGFGDVKLCSTDGKIISGSEEL
jgi:predicted Zn-dependent peptidase